PAAGHRAGAADRPGDPRARRLHQRRRLRHRGPDPAGHRPGARRPHHAADHPPTVPDPVGRQDPAAAPRRAGRLRHPRRAAGAEPALPADLRSLRRDPARRRRRAGPGGRAGEGGLMGFLMDGLEAEDYDRTYDDRELLRRILSYFRPKFGAMLLVAAMIVLGSLGQAAGPLLISWGVDAVQDGTIGDIAWPLTGALLLTGVLGWVFNFFRQWYSARVTGDVVLRLREDAFDAVLQRDLSFYDETPSGRIVSRVTSDTDDFATVSTLTMDLISQVLMVGFVTVLLFMRSVELALLT